MLLILIDEPQWRVNRSFVEAEGLVVDQRDVPSEGGGFRQVRIRSSVNGVDVEHWNDGEMTLGMDEGRIQGRIRAMAIGERLPVWYDPVSPEVVVVVVERGYWIHWGLHLIAAGMASRVADGMAVGRRGWESRASRTGQMPPVPGAAAAGVAGVAGSHAPRQGVMVQA